MTRVLRPATAAQVLAGPFASKADAQADVAAVAVSGLVSAGIPVTVAAGNALNDACLYSPAAASAAVTVGSTNNARAFSSSFSNYGPCVDTFAPGESILLLCASSPTCEWYESGTSFSTPTVAGGVALLLSANPTLSPAQISTALLGGSTATGVPAVTTTSFLCVRVSRRRLRLPPQARLLHLAPLLACSLSLSLTVTAALWAAAIWPSRTAR